MRYHEPFTLVNRGRTRLRVWTYRVYDTDGRRLEFSTGIPVDDSSEKALEKSRKLAYAYVLKLYKEDRLIPEPAARRGLTFAGFAAGLFDPAGEFATRRAVTEKGPYSRNYLSASDTAVRVHLIPAFGKKRLDRIGLADVERWTLDKLAEKDPEGKPRYTPKTVRNYLQTLVVVLQEAARRGLIKASPAVRPLLPSKAPRVKRDALSPEEIRRLFDVSTEAQVWQGSPLVRGAVLVALGTGARIGEVRAIRGSDVHPGWLEIARSWSATEGEKSTKSGKPRIAPLPKAAQAVLDGLKKARGDGLLFTLNGKTPMSARHLQERFQAALTAIGIPPEEQEARGQTFHALRVTFNSLVRAANVSQAKLQAVVGHESKELSDRYTAFRPEDLEEVRLAAEAMLSAPVKRGRGKKNGRA